MKVSNLGFGASSLGGVFHGIREEEAIEAVNVAENIGMNFRAALDMAEALELQPVTFEARKRCI